MACPPHCTNHGGMTDQRVLKPYDVEIALNVGRDEVWDAVTQGYPDFFK